MTESGEALPPFQIDVHGDEAFFYEECHDIGDFDLSTRFIAADSYLAGTLRKVQAEWLFWIMEQNAMYESAIRELRRAAELSGDNPIDVGALGHVYAVSGQHKRALQALEELRQLSAKRYVSSYEFALVYAGLGDNDKAIQWLDKAFLEHSAWMLHLKVDPRLDPLRSDPRFQELQRRVGLS